MKKTFVAVIIVLVVLVAGFFILNQYIYNTKQAPNLDSSINSYEDCVAAGHSIMKSNPEQCQTPDGRTFTRDVSLEFDENINDNNINEDITYSEEDATNERIVDTEIVDSCLVNRGTWVSGFNECEYTNETWCQENGGIFNECASACRNQPEAEFCTMQCVPVCSFNY